MSKIFTGSGRLFQEIKALDLDNEGLSDVEKRVKFQPHFLGEPFVVIAESCDFPHIVSKSTHCLVALDVMGRAVVISLAAGTADVAEHTGSLQLAAYLSNIHPEELGKIAKSFISRPANDSMCRTWEEMGVEMSEETVEITSLLAATFKRDAEDYSELINSEQRIIIAAEGFSSRLVSLIQWLCKSGTGITGLRYRRFMVGGQEIYFAEQVVPMVDPADDALDPSGQLPGEVSEPWRTKGRAYHLDRLKPEVGNLLNQMLIAIRDNTFSINWSHKYYFWIRGPRRNFRIRTYFRDRLEIGFYNASPKAIEDFVRKHDLINLDVSTVGGYTDSPFITLTGEMELTDQWVNMLNDWLHGPELEED